MFIEPVRAINLDRADGANSFVRGRSASGHCRAATDGELFAVSADRAAARRSRLRPGAPHSFAFSTGALPIAAAPYTVNFGDGTTGALTPRPVASASPRSSGGQGGIQCTGTASHAYTSSGSYPATLLNASSQTLGIATITVTGAAPKVGFAATSPSAPGAGIEYSRIDPSGGIAPPNQAAPLGSAKRFRRCKTRCKIDPRQTLGVPFAGSNATVPTTSSFTASPASISPFAEGGGATLSWSVASATSLSISGLGAVTRHF